MKLIDFGESVILTSEEEMLSEKRGTSYFMAPEVIDESLTYNTKCDIWSSGVILYLLLVGDYPFKGKTLKDISKQILKHRYPFLYKQRYRSISDAGRHLILKMLAFD